MIVTVTNLQATKMGEFDVYEGYSGILPPISAVGGSRKDPLPYPFEWVVLGPNGGGADAKSLAMHPQDFRFRHYFGNGFEPRDEWNTLVQRNKITFGIGAEAGRREVEELFVNAV